MTNSPLTSARAIRSSPGASSVWQRSTIRPTTRSSPMPAPSSARPTACFRSKPGSDEPMYKHILIATDGSERSQRAVADGVALALALGARVTALTVLVPLRATEPKPVADIPGSGDFVREYLHGQANEILAAAENLAAEQGMSCDTVRVDHEHPYRAIIETA